MNNSNTHTWRDVANDNSPAGPLFTGGQHAEAEVALAGFSVASTNTGGCSVSANSFCCP
jgi:hypothetical protein